MGTSEWGVKIAVIRLSPFVYPPLCVFVSLLFTFVVWPRELPVKLID